LKTGKGRCLTENDFQKKMRRGEIPKKAIEELAGRASVCDHSAPLGAQKPPGEVQPFRCADLVHVSVFSDLRAIPLC
jgi:hypothetical protein